MSQVGEMVEAHAGIVRSLRPEEAAEVATIHAAMMPESLYAHLGRPFLQYYYERMLKNDDFFCLVYAINQTVVGFLAGTTATQEVFRRQVMQDPLRLSRVVMGLLREAPFRIKPLLLASRYLLMQRHKLLPTAEGEILAIATLPQYRKQQAGRHVAVELFEAAVSHFADRGVQEVRVATLAENHVANRFFIKMGCRLVVSGIQVVDESTNLYSGRLCDLLEVERKRRGPPLPGLVKAQRRGWPDFFIVGAPRSGTTALSEYLKQHPQVYLPPANEIHFFGTDLAMNYPAHTREAKRYLSWFQAARPGQRIGEKSIWYLYSKRAAAEIHALCPDAQIIIMLRDPIEMIYALHNQLLLTGNEAIADFQAALDAEEDRWEGRRVPQSPFSPELLFYRQIARYTDQVQRYLEFFGRDRVQIIVFDDFVHHTDEAYRQTLRFLGLNEECPPAFPVINANKRVRSRVLSRLVANMSPAAQRVSRAALKRPMIGQMLRKLQELNTWTAPRPPMASDLRKQLQADFAPEVARLSQLLGRDVSHWCAS